jgi:hypothetical protein
MNTLEAATVAPSRSGQRPSKSHVKLTVASLLNHGGLLNLFAVAAAVPLLTRLWSLAQLHPVTSSIRNPTSTVARSNGVFFLLALYPAMMSL